MRIRPLPGALRVLAHAPCLAACTTCPVSWSCPVWMAQARTSSPYLLLPAAQTCCAAECLPHDPLFDVLPAPGASRRSPPKREQVVAALQAAAQDAAALVNASGAGLVADSSLLASTLLPGMAPPTCGRNKRSADVPAPATQLQLERGRAPGCAPAATAAVKPAWPALPTAAAATPGAATPAPATAQAAGKRQRMLLLTAARGTVATPGCGATPGSGVGSNSRVPAKAVRRVARDLSFTPAPAPQQLGSTGEREWAGLWSC